MIYQWRSRADSAGYECKFDRLPDLYADDVLSEWKHPCPELVESFGDEDIRRKPRKKLDFHTAIPFGYILSDRAAKALGDFLAKSGTLYPLSIENRTGPFWYYWCTAFEDCLDLEHTTSGENYSGNPEKLGFIKRPVFDPRKTPEHDIFRIPQDPNLTYYVTDRFKEAIIGAELRGFSLRTHIMDSKPWES